jgi:sodium/proline symporter
VALIAVYLARKPESQVLDLVSYAWAGFGAAFGPVVILSLFWKRMTRNGALAGVLVGALVVIGWKLAHDRYAALHRAAPDLAWVPEWLRLYEIVPGFIAATLCIFVVSLLGRAPPAKVQETFSAVRADLRDNGY